jgi:hypothetical protein
LYNDDDDDGDDKVKSLSLMGVMVMMLRRNSRTKLPSIRDIKLASATLLCVYAAAALSLSFECSLSAGTMRRGGGRKKNWREEDCNKEVEIILNTLVFSSAMQKSALK